MAEKKSSLNPSLQLSSAIVKYLREEGYVLKKIGELMEVKESFICRVRKGERALTLNHLIRLEKSLGRSISLILTETRKRYPLDLS